MGKCSKENIKKTAIEIVDLEEEVDNLIEIKNDHGLESEAQESLDWKRGRIERLRNEIEECGKDPNEEIERAENDRDDEEEPEDDDE